MRWSFAKAGLLVSIFLSASAVGGVALAGSGGHGPGGSNGPSGPTGPTGAGSAPTAVCTLSATYYVQGGVTYYSGTVTVTQASPGYSLNINDYKLQVQSSNTTGKETIYTSPANIDSPSATFSNISSTFSSSDELSAHVYGYTAPNGQRWTTDCKTEPTEVPVNQLPEAPWAAGFPLLLGAGAVALYRRKRTSSMGN